MDHRRTESKDPETDSSLKKSKKKTINEKQRNSYYSPGRGENRIS